MLPPGVGGPGRPPAELRLDPARTLSLPVGAQVTATVEAVAGDAAWLRLAGQLVRARLVDLALAVGERLTLEVAAADGPLWLRRVDAPAPPAAPAPAPPAAPAPAPPAAPAPAPAGEPAAALRPRLDALARALRQAATAANPARAGRLGALAAELEAWGWHPAPPQPAPPAPDPEAPAPPQPGGLRTLPAVLVEVREALGGAPAGKARAAAAGALEEAAAHLAAIRRQAAPEAGAPAWVLVPLPVHLPHGPGEVLLARRRQQGRRPGAGAPSGEEEVQLFLQGPHLGPLAVDLRLQGGSVAATVTVGSEDARAALAAALPALAAALATAGLAVGRLAAVVGNPAPPPLPAPPAGTARLDRRV